ncbi:MAG TPA: hypothetical protein PLE60_14610 [Candidatus Latescibacteria bacterium]|nr:hypothetical protein [Candidatus Latescibacterota bacterium]
MDEAVEELKRIFNTVAPPGCGIDSGPPPDIAAFDAAMAECRHVFMERRGEYGSHLDRLNAREYVRDGIKIKTARILDDVRAGQKVKRDTMIDAVDYMLMALSFRHVQEGG